MMCVKTVSAMKGEKAVKSLIQIHFPEAKTFYEPTYGRGLLWDRPVIGSDLNPACAKDFVADFRHIPLKNKAIDVVVYDPPFFPSGPGYSTSIAGHRYGGLGHRHEMISNYQQGAREAFRVAKMGLIAKTQDYVNARKVVWLSLCLHQTLGFPEDLLITVRGAPKHPAWKQQDHTRRNCAFYWVYLK